MATDGQVNTTVAPSAASTPYSAVVPHLSSPESVLMELAGRCSVLGALLERLALVALASSEGGRGGSLLGGGLFPLQLLHGDSPPGQAGTAG